MIDDDVNEQLKNLNERLAGVEQILPTLATRQDLSQVATKAEVALLATRAELREEGEKTRRHMDVIAEHLIGQMAMLYEGHTRHTEVLDGHQRRLEAVEMKHDGLDQRVQAVERTRARRPR